MKSRIVAVFIGSIMLQHKQDKHAALPLTPYPAFQSIIAETFSNNFKLKTVSSAV